MDELKNVVLNLPAEELLKKIPDQSIDLVVTDPPYNMDYSGRGKVNSFDGFLNDNLTPEEHTEWFDGILQEFYRVLKEDTAVYIFIDFRNYARMFDIVKKYFTIKNCIVWDKCSIGMGQSYRFQHEFIIYAIKGKPKLNFVKRNVSDVWHIKRASGYKHPTQKPLDIMMLPIEYSSKEEDVVLDPFVGSGTVAVACKALNRNFICSDVSKEYCDLSNERLCHQ